MSHTDIRAEDGWVARAPLWLRPYLLLGRFDRPVGVWLLLLPAWWAVALSAPSLAVAAKLAALFFLGAFVLRAAGCAINDLLDRKLDAEVERTRGRPLASGALTPLQAVGFIALMLMAGAFVLFSLPRLAVGLGFLSLVLIVLYPLMKRVTWWPQLFLGLTFNWGVLMGYAAALEAIPSAAWWLYAAGILWTLSYDTVYAAQDREDDARIGIKSSALALGTRIKPFVALATLGLGVALIVVAMKSGLSPVFWPVFTVAVFWAVREVKDWRPKEAQDSLRRFKANVPLGFLILLAFVFGRVG